MFGFTVPVAPADAPGGRPAHAAGRPPATPPQALRPGIEVLVVEDNAVVAASLVALQNVVGAAQVATAQRG